MKLTIFITFLITAILASLSLVNAGYSDPNFVPGRNTIVHLFEWKWVDIAAECERFLGPYGYGGVQVSPPNENAVINEPPRPWWERYQPVSYKLETRSGTEAQFQTMVRTCNSAGVRIYVDAVINHMTHFSTVGAGTAGSSFNSNAKEYPALSLRNEHFHGPAECSTGSGSIEDHLDPIQSRNCEVGGLRDLDQGNQFVRTQISEYLNRLIGYGVAGFRIDCAKQIWPVDMKAIFDSLDNLPTDHNFPAGTRPFVYQEVIMFEVEPIKHSEYYPTGIVTEFLFGYQLGGFFRGQKPLAQLSNFGSELIPSEYALVFVDNHDNQRGHGAGGGNIITFREGRLYKMATAFTLGWTYGHAQIMSSYFWDGQDSNSWVGPPSTGGVIDSPIINPMYGTCDEKWICEHRWRQIKHMVQFRNIVAGTPVASWWDNGNNQIAFCRGDKGFLAINNDSAPLNNLLQTCLAPGRYCDVITGELENGLCTGRVVEVTQGGWAIIFIPAGDEEGALAIHVESKLP